MQQNYMMAAAAVVVFVFVVMLSINKKSEPRLCQFGPWVPCKNGLQHRYAIYATSEPSSSEITFECGKKRKVDTRECSEGPGCTMDLASYCVCTAYDNTGKCTKQETTLGKCLDATYTPGSCGENPPSSQMCTWGPWLGCDDTDKQSRYAIYASDSDPNTFPCGNTRKTETRDCLHTVCTRDMNPYCACVGYDMQNNCKKEDVFGSCSIRGTDQYTIGECIK